MTRFMVANSQGFGPTRCRLRVFERSLIFALLVFSVASGFFASTPELSAQSVGEILVTVKDDDQHPLAGVTIEGKSDSALICKAVTDVQGLAALSDCGSSAGLRLTASLLGYFPVTTGVPLQDQASIEITLSKRILVQETAEVQLIREAF